MTIESWARALENHRRIVLIAGILIGVSGLNFLLFPTHDAVPEWAALAALVTGTAIVSMVVSAGRKVASAGGTRTLGNRLLDRVTFRGRLLPAFPALGGAMIALDLAYNALVSTTPQLLAEDTVVLLLGSALVAYSYIPARFARERDFILLFFLVLSAVLVAPLLAARAISGDVDASVDMYSWVALAPETGALLNLLGVSNTLQTIPGSTAPALTFTPAHLTSPVTVVITTACSGIYSFGIFASAFTSYVLTEYPRPTRRIWALLALGFVAAYVANILRMAIIVLIGYYSDTPATDLQNMLLAHSYAGWILFIVWIAAFWAALLRVLGPRDTQSSAMQVAGTRDRRSRCAICLEDLSPAIPGVRCECGRLYHRHCLRTAGSCPSCGRADAKASVTSSDSP